MGVEVRSLTGDDLEPAWQLDRVAFNTPESRREAWLARIDPERTCGVFEGSRLVAMATALPAGESLAGHPLECRPGRTLGLVVVGLADFAPRDVALFPQHAEDGPQGGVVEGPIQAGLDLGRFEFVIVPEHVHDL